MKESKPAAAETPTNYRSFTDQDVLLTENNDDATTTAAASSTTNAYRGFSTSIHDMYKYPEYERVDCCALTCGGILQSDRDRYLLQGVAPPGPCRRLFLHVILPVGLFFTAGFAAMHVENPVLNEITCVALLVMMIVYACMQCYKGRSKRIEVRKDLLYTMYQMQQSPETDLWQLLEEDRPDDNDETKNYYYNQSKRDFRAAHPSCFCGCYPEDRSMEEINQQGSTELGNTCRWLFTTCWGPTCGMHLQCCGACALAQEGREVERLLPPSYRRVDYISMQAVSDYYPAVYSHKHGIAMTAAPRQSFSLLKRCLPPMSRLSFHIVKAWIYIVIIAFVLTCGAEIYEKLALSHQHRYRFVPTSILDVYDFVVFSLEWLETLVILSIFAWLINRVKESGLSFDALLKYFASGFVLSVVTAIFWEIVVGVFLKAFMSIVLAISGIDAVQEPDSYSLTGVVGGFGATKVVRRLNVDDDDATSSNFLKTFGYEHPIFYTIIIFIDAFVVAALIEELSKYFGFRMVEHPDFMSREELDEAMNMAHHHHNDENEDDELQTDVQDATNETHSHFDFGLQKQSKQAEGAAITLAMVTVAMGFTCCENFAYIFLYSGGSFQAELGTMIVRAFFPIHPLCAALQSLGVVSRDVENDRSVTLGKILFPAVLLHGSYDFFLMWIDYLYKRRGKEAMEDASGVLFSWMLSCTMVIISLVYLVKQSRLQRQRLIDIDRQTSVDRSSLI